MKKIPLRAILWMTYLLAVAGGALGSMRIVAHATSAQAASETEELTEVSRDYYEKWYELSDDGSELVLRLENHIPGYAWKLGSSNDMILKIVDHYYDKYNDKIIVMASSEGKSGDVILTAACMKDINTKPIDRRQIILHIEGGQISVSSEKR